MVRLPKQIKVRCPNCGNVDLLSNQRPTIRTNKILLACNKCKAEMHITEEQIEMWKQKAQELRPKENRKK